MRRGVVGAFVAIAAALACFAPAAMASSAIEHLHFHAGPYAITPGANLILLQSNQVPKPAQDGYMIQMKPNLHYALGNGACCGAVPHTDVIHLHHGVWLSDGKAGEGEANSAYGGFYPFMAAGEEKTTYEFGKGYGYPVGAGDHWILNYMIHNLTAQAAKVYITYDVEFVPMTSPLARSLTPVHPIWMDVEDGSIYPVFDVHRFSGHNGKYTFPDMAHNPYDGGTPRNVFTVDHPGTLVGTGGHLHPGGLWDELDLIRRGTTPRVGAVAGTTPNSVRLFRSYANYFGGRPPVSWDVAMNVTNADWKVNVRAGDVMRISTTYETRLASWYESMGIMVVWEAWNVDRGVNPFTHPLDLGGHLTHGHLPENNHYGGDLSLGINLRSIRTCRTNKVVISNFLYTPGDFFATGKNRCVPTVTQGQSLTFVNNDASPLSTLSLFNPSKYYLHSIFHSITSCQNPCGLDTGISYPLANGPGNYDSGQLGLGTPAIGRLSWSTPANLRPGTYTFFCRIHPFMRGVFRIIG